MVETRSFAPDVDRESLEVFTDIFQIFTPGNIAAATLGFTSEHSRLHSFPLLPITVSKFQFYSHSMGIPFPLGIPFYLGILFPWSSLA